MAITKDRFVKLVGDNVRDIYNEKYHLVTIVVFAKKHTIKVDRVSGVSSLFGPKFVISLLVTSTWCLKRKKFIKYKPKGRELTQHNRYLRFRIYPQVRSYFTAFGVESTRYKVGRIKYL